MHSGCLGKYRTIAWIMMALYCTYIRPRIRFLIFKMHRFQDVYSFYWQAWLTSIQMILFHMDNFWSVQNFCAKLLPLVILCILKQFWCLPHLPSPYLHLSTIIIILISTCLIKLIKSFHAPFHLLWYECVNDKVTKNINDSQ